MRSAIHVLLVVAGVVVGGVGSSWVQSGARGDVAAAPAIEERAAYATEPAHVISAPSASASLDPELLRAIVRDELSREGERARAEAAPAATVIPLDPAQQRAAIEARDLFEEHLEGALAEGVWDDADRAAAMDSLPHMAIADREELLLALARAINEGRLAVTSNGAPWG